MLIVNCCAIETVAISIMLSIDATLFI